jgi:hypothetical protein
MGEVGVVDEDTNDDEDAVEDEDASDWPRTATIAPMTASRPATRVQRSRIRRVVARAGSR